jgi:formate C-acetyltransferase
LGVYIPGCGDDIPNIGALNFPLAARRAICGTLEQGGDFDAVLEQTRREIQAQCRQIMAQVHDLFVMPSPVLDLLRSPVRYRNFGIHGCGLAPAVDALAAVRRYVFEEKSVSVSRLLRGLDQDYQDDPELFHLLRYEAPKMGQADPRTDQLASVLLRAFADAVEGKRNCCGGIWARRHRQRHVLCVAGSKTGRHGRRAAQRRSVWRELFTKPVCQAARPGFCG